MPEGERVVWRYWQNHTDPLHIPSSYRLSHTQMQYHPQASWHLSMFFADDARAPQADGATHRQNMKARRQPSARYAHTPTSTTATTAYLQGADGRQKNCARIAPELRRIARSAPNERGAAAADAPPVAAEQQRGGGGEGDRERLLRRAHVQVVRQPSAPPDAAGPSSSTVRSSSRVAAAKTDQTRVASGTSSAKRGSATASVDAAPPASTISAPW